MLSVIASHIIISSGRYDYSIFDYSRSAFLLISGYLYANKEIVNKKVFLINRAIKILLPMWIWSLFISIMEIVGTHQITLPISSFFIVLFNLQGLDSILIFGDYFSDRLLDSVAAFWFVTVIFICYIILALIKNTKIDKWIKNNKKIFIGVLIVSQVLFVFMFKIQLGYMFSFFIGYAFYSTNEIDKKKTVLYLIFVVIFGLLRIKLRSSIDGTLFYNEIILPNFNTVAAAFIIIFCLYLQKRFNLFNRLCNTRFYKELEKDSYYLYITHEFFLYGTFRVNNYTNSTFINFVLFAVLSICCTKLLKNICEQYNMHINNKYIKEIDNEK